MKINKYKSHRYGEMEGVETTDIVLIALTYVALAGAFIFAIETISNVTDLIITYADVIGH